MSDLDLNACKLFGEALRYPTPGLNDRVDAGAPAVKDQEARRALSQFAAATKILSIGEWEELYTRTFDLNPAVAPYLGYQIWGDGYPRGTLMSNLNRAYHAQGMDDLSELPDHISLVLRYLGTSAEVPPDLAEVFVPAAQKMVAVLSKADGDNPYLSLLKAICATVAIQIQPAG